MRTQNAICFFGLFLGFCFFNSTTAQETYYFDYHEIEVTKEQHKKLIQLEEKYEDGITKLSNQSGESRQELAILMAEMKVEMESVLTEKQNSELVKKQFDKTKKEAKATASSLQAFGSLVEKLGATKKLIVYEGLPRGSKNELRELAAKHKTIKIDGFLFYEKALAPSETTLERLRGTLCDHRSLIPYRGAKFCGGFHPDFAIKFSDGDQTYHVLICFSCAELKFILPTHSTRFDLAQEAWHAFIQFGATSFRMRKEEIKTFQSIFK